VSVAPPSFTAPPGLSPERPAKDLKPLSFSRVFTKGITVFGFDSLVLFGLVSAALSVVGYFPYIRDTLLGKTSPQRSSWLVWSILSSIALATQVAEGATGSLAFVAVQSGGTILVFILSIFTGRGGYFRRGDAQVLTAAAVGLALWTISDNAAFALAMVIAVSLSGGLLTIRKAYHLPSSETRSTWVLFLLSSVCGVLAVGSFDLMLLAYPVYLTGLYLAIVVSMRIGQSRTPMQPTLTPTGS
jgi:hypothetical protein